MIDEYQVKKLMEGALQQTEDILEKVCSQNYIQHFFVVSSNTWNWSLFQEQEVVNLRKQLNDVIKERERWDPFRLQANL